jgi:hypothetical protein
MMAPERQNVTSVSAIVAASVRPLRQLRPERKLFALGRAENHLSVPTRTRYTRDRKEQPVVGDRVTLTESLMPDGPRAGLRREQGSHSTKG